jgi:hypothetical protein
MNKINNKLKLFFNFTILIKKNIKKIFSFIFLQFIMNLNKVSKLLNFKQLNL